MLSQLAFKKETYNFQFHNCFPNSCENDSAADYPLLNQCTGISYQALEPTLPFVFTTQNWSNYEQAITTDADLSSADQLRPVRISLFPHLHTPFSPSLKSLMVSVEIKHHIYLLFDQQADLYIAFEFQFSLTRVEYLISHHEYGSWPWHSTKGHWNCPCTCNAQWLLFQLT